MGLGPCVYSILLIKSCTRHVPAGTLTGGATAGKATVDGKFTWTPVPGAQVYHLTVRDLKTGTYVVEAYSGQDIDGHQIVVP